MADVFIDCEWIHGDYITILGAYSVGQSRFQLYNETLTRRRFSRFVNCCNNRNTSRYVFLFCHGPDVGKIIKHFNLRLKRNYYCINTINAFNRFTRFRTKSLGYLEQQFGLPRTHALSSCEISKLWSSDNRCDRQIVLDYNWEDCVNLWRLVTILKNNYGVTRSDLKAISMDP